MGAGTGKRSPSRSTAGSISSEDSSDGGGVVKQKGQQGAGLVKDMYKMFDGSALVALGKHSLQTGCLQLIVAPRSFRSRAHRTICATRPEF